MTPDVRRQKLHATGIRELREAGVKPRDTGEVLSYPDVATRAQMAGRFRLNSKDEGEARRGWRKFQQSSEYKRFSPHKNRLTVVRR